MFKVQTAGRTNALPASAATCTCIIERGDTVQYRTVFSRKVSEGVTLFSISTLPFDSSWLFFWLWF